MKTKIVISFFLMLSILSFHFIKPGGESTSASDPGNTVIAVSKNNISRQEQQKYLDYLSSAKINKLECETDYRYHETGGVTDDNSEHGKGEKVVHCASGTDKPGYIVRGAILPRVEKINSKWLNDTLYTFYLKPRIRIKKELIYPLIENYNHQNLHTPVCRIEIVNTEGKVVKEVEYKAKDFLEKHPDDDGRVYYSGKYIEGPGGYLGSDSLIIINGMEINPKGKLSKEKAGPDYRVYWYGYTDMWLDYIEIKNETAVDLLTGNYDRWLAAMDSINITEFERIIITPGQQECMDYILDKIKNREFVSQWNSDIR